MDKDERTQDPVDGLLDDQPTATNDPAALQVDDQVDSQPADQPADQVVAGDQPADAQLPATDGPVGEPVDREPMMFGGQPVLHGDGAPGEPETYEQGLVRTGRAQPRHASDEDSAGLTPEETAARVEQTHEQRDETHRVVTEQGHLAGGDGTGSGGPEAPRE